MRRRRIDVDNLGENTQISLKLPKKVLDWIEDACNEDSKFTGRSHFIDNACRYYLNLKPCPSCGKLNPRDAVVCAYCRFELDGMENIINVVQPHVIKFEDLHEEGFVLVDACNSLCTELEEYIGAQDPTTQKQIRDKLSKLRERFGIRIQNALDYFNTYESQAASFTPFEFQQNFELKIPDYSSLYEKCCSIIYGVEYMEKCQDTKNLIPVIVMAGLYYYNIAKHILDGDCYSSNEINNLRIGFEYTNNAILNYVEILRDGYRLLEVSKSLAVLVASGNS